jgi:predicted PurR-regulated permease PerM
VSSRGGGGGQPYPEELIGSVDPRGIPADDPLLDTGVRQLAAQVSEEEPFGRPGRPLNRRSPYFVGLAASLGAASALVLAWAVYAAREVLLLIGVSLFLAVGLDPVVRWLSRRGLPRPLGVLVVVLALLGAAAGFLWRAIPPLSREVSTFASQAPRYLNHLTHHSILGRLNAHYHIANGIHSLFKLHSSAIASGLLGAGKFVLGLLTALVIVAVLTIYLLVDLPRLKRALYRLAPRSRRPRVGLLADEVFNRVGGYVLGNVITSLIAGVGTLVWLAGWGVPYPWLLGAMVAFLDLIPVIGSTIGGLIVSLVALTVSLPVALATAGFYLFYRLFEDYLLTPKVMRRTVDVPNLVTIVAVLVGGALLGIVGALIAIPVAAAVLLVLQEVTYPRLDER